MPYRDIDVEAISLCPSSLKLDVLEANEWREAVIWEEMAPQSQAPSRVGCSKSQHDGCWDLRKSSRRARENHFFSADLSVIKLKYFFPFV